MVGQQTTQERGRGWHVPKWVHPVYAAVLDDLRCRKHRGDQNSSRSIPPSHTTAPGMGPKPLRVERWSRRQVVATVPHLLFSRPPPNVTVGHHSPSPVLTPRPGVCPLCRRHGCSTPPPPPFCISTAPGPPLLAAEARVGMAPRRTSDGGRHPSRPPPSCSASPLPFTRTALAAAVSAGTMGVVRRTP